MKRYGLVVLLIFLLCGAFSLSAQNMNVQHLWGKSIGKAHNDRDFLIYDAFCREIHDDNPRTLIYIVGKAESGTDFELNRGENTYCYEKDDYTDAFLACYSLDGELLWSTYLPALEDGYYNAFATTADISGFNSLTVVGNAYRIQGDISHTQNMIPACVGKLFYFEFTLDGILLRSKSSTLNYTGNNIPSIYPPRLFRGVARSMGDDMLLYLPGIAYTNTVLKNQTPYGDYIYSGGCTTHITWQDNLPYNILLSTTYNNHATVYSSFYYLSNIWGVGLYQAAYLLQELHTGEESWFYTVETGVSAKKDEESISSKDIYARGVNFSDMPVIRERWSVVMHASHDKSHYYANPIVTLNNENQSIFPGTVQNIRTYGDKFLVQGIHCRNYDNGFFKKDGEPYAYSHDTEHLIPRTGGFYQERNDRHTSVPYLLLYDSTTLFIQYPEPDVPIVPDEKATKDVLDFETPLWGTYLNADWMYEDFFHITDSGHKKDLYQPYEPILCSSGDKFFLIGNAKSIGTDLVGNLSMTEELLHHQGVILAFSISDCPPEKTSFEDVRFLCPDDSVELKLSPDYAGFKFRFDNASLADGSIVLNADSSRAWAKKEGTFAAVLDGSSLGCPDVTVDTVRISSSPYPEPVSGMPHVIIAACAAEGVVLNPVVAPDTSFSYHWFDGDSVVPKTVHFVDEISFFASVEVNGYCTSFRDSVRIRFLPPYVALGPDSLLCSSQSFADTSLMMRLTARQNYFPDADWIFHWKINGMEASDSGSQPLHYADLQLAGDDLRRAVVTVAVSLSDADVDGCTAHDTLEFSLVSLPDDSANVFLPQSEILCAHQDLELFLPKADDYRCFWLDRDSVALPYGYDTARYTVQGMRGLDGYGAGTDTREPRFFQLRLDHKLCGVSFFDTLLVYDQVKPVFELTCHDTLICLDEPVEMDSLSPHVYRPFYVFEWNDGKKGSDYTFTDSGVYVLQFFVGKDFAVCGYDTVSDTIRVRWSDPAQTLITLGDTSFCEKLSVTLDASVPFPTTLYSWQEGSLPDPEEIFEDEEDTIIFTSPVKVFKEEGTYNISLFDTMGCINRKEIAVTIDDCSPKLDIPNVFTPNGDGVNDVWKFKQLEYCIDVKVEVVDRWGQPVLKTKVATADDFEWNGTVNNRGRRLPDGPYFYMVSYKDVYGKSRVQSGSITILGTSE